MNTKSMFSEAEPMTPEQAAEAAIRGFCRWHVAPLVTDTWVLDGAGGPRMLVPSLRIKRVLSLEINGIEVAPEQVEFSERSGVIGRRGGASWPEGLGNIKLTVTHGYETPPDELAALWGTLTRRIANYGGSILAERAGSQSVTYQATNSATAAGATLGRAERDVLQPYRITWGP